jgi:hypothetical protein
LGPSISAHDVHVTTGRHGCIAGGEVNKATGCAVLCASGKGSAGKFIVTGTTYKLNGAVASATRNLYSSTISSQGGAARKEDAARPIASSDTDVAARNCASGRVNADIAARAGRAGARLEDHATTITTSAT